jgi:transposase
MQDIALFAQLLGLTPPWKVTKLTPDLTARTITIRIEWPQGEQGPCPDCQAMCSVYDHREVRAWRHLDTMQFKTLLVCPVPRVTCHVHGVKSIQVPWADMKGRFTLLFERFAIDMLLAASSLSKAAKLLGLSWDEVHHIQKRGVERGLARRSLEKTEHLGIDEKSFLKGQSYVSVLYDLDESRVLDLVKDRTTEAATKLLNVFPEDKRPLIKAFAVDMWKPFMTAITDVFPNSTVVHDKYHIVSYLNKAVNEVRHKENKLLAEDGIGSLKGTKFIWLRNILNWTKRDKKIFNALKNDGLKVGRAWSIKQLFLSLWDYTYEKSARKFFKKWYYWATHSQLKPIIKVAKMLKNHQENILTYLQHPITNAKAEGMNSKIQSIKAAARGFRNFENYRISILFHCGKLELHP